MLNWQKMAPFTVFLTQFCDGSVKTWSKKETIAWGPYTPPPTLETFSKKISASTRSRIEIVSEFTDKDDDTKFMKSRVS